MDLPKPDNFMFLADFYASKARTSDGMRRDCFEDLSALLYAIADRIERAQIEAADQLRLPMEISCRAPFAREVV